MSARDTRIAILAADVDGTGGIQRATRDLIAACRELYGDDAVTVVSAAVTGGRVTLRSQLAFAVSALRAATRKNTLLIVSLVSLTPVALLASRLFGRRYVTVVYGVDVWRRLPLLTRKGLERSAAVWSISDFTAGMLLKHNPMPASSVQLLQLACSLDPSQTPPDDATGQDPQKVLTVSRLVRTDRFKGVATLIEAWPQVLRGCPDATLTVVGSGDDEQHPRLLAERLGVTESVRFLGRVSDEALRAEFRSSAVFALPGSFHEVPPQGEGFGLVFIEAALAGLPTVAGRAAGAVEAVVDGVTGLLCDPEDVDDVAACVLQLLRDPELAQTLGEQGRRRAVEQFSPEAYRERVRAAVAAMTVGAEGIEPPTTRL